MTSSRPQKASPDIAIVAMDGLFPGSLDVQQFWDHIFEGSDLVTDIPEGHWRIADYYDPDQSVPDKTYGKRGGFLPKVPFDTLKWGIPPTLLSQTDTSQLLGLIVARRVLDQAFGGNSDDADKSRISCILGVTSGQELFGQMASRLRRPQWKAGLLEAGLSEAEADEACKHIADKFVPWTESTFPGLLGNVVAGRIANRLDLGGTNAVTDAACASSFAALSMAVDELVLGRADMVLSGGVDALNDIFMYMCFSKTPALSQSGRVAPFDVGADGTLLGEGAGLVALKRLEDAERDGNDIYAVIKGVGTSSDGRSKSVYAPVSAGQANAIRRAYDVAGYGPDSVELVEAHGTGTKAGDVAEVGGLKLAFDDGARQDRQWCQLGSVKSQIGHTKSAAGTAGLMKIALALHEKVLPPTININEPNPKAEFDKSPFYLSTKPRPWLRGQSHPRRASVSSFGFGGSNFHITVEEYTGKSHNPGRLRQRSAELLAFSAEDKATLAAQLNAAATALDQEPLFDVAKRAADAFSPAHAARVTLVASDVEGAQRALRQAAGALHVGQTPTAPGVFFGEGQPEGKVAILCAGQGSQYVGMGEQLLLEWPAARAALDALYDDARFGDEHLYDVLVPKPAWTDAQKAAQQTRLTATEWAQPALGAMAAAHLGALRDLGFDFDMAAGHSYGELAALYATDALSGADLMKLSRARGEAMRDVATTPGTMSAVFASRDDTAQAVDGLDVVLANENTPRQTVIAGAVADIEKAEAALQKAGLKFSRLQVACAFHSPHVAPAAEQLAKVLDGLSVREPQKPVYQNRTAKPYNGIADIKSGLAAQLKSSVRFVSEIEAMYDAGARTFVEVGPKNALTGMVDKILADKPHRALSADVAQKGDTAALLTLVAGLAAAGQPLTVAKLFAGFRPKMRHEDAPAHATLIDGSNVGKPNLDVKERPRPMRAAEAPAPSASRPVSASAAPVPTMDKPRNVSAPTVTAAATSAPAVTAPQVYAAAPQGLLDVVREGQRQTAEAQAAFTKAITDAHMAFLAAFEQSTAQLGAFGGQMPLHVPAPAPAAPAFAAPAPVVATPVPAPVSAPAPVVAAPAPVPVPAPAPVVAAPATAATPSVDLMPIFMDVVADKTGYPVAALRPDMHLEADLGIDSIKRVEILSAIKAKAPNLKDVDATTLAQKNTIQEVADALLDASGTPAAAPATPAGAPAGDLMPIFMGVVADKTGYPVSALRPDMHLEADLGIDSIKRVEILSAIKAKAPNLKDVDATTLAQKNTIQEVADALLGDAVSAAPVAAAAPSSGGTDLMPIFMGVVADKTGYPVSALRPDMHLEADLGIDSIKRVEILSAIKAKAPNLKDVDATTLAQKNTIQEVADALLGDTAPAAAPVAVAAPVSTPAAPMTPRVLDVADALLPPPNVSFGPTDVVAVTPSAHTDAVIAALAARGVKAVPLPLNGNTDRCRGFIELSGLDDSPSLDDAQAALTTALSRARTVAKVAQRHAGFRAMFVYAGGGSLGFDTPQNIEAGRAEAVRAGISGLAKTCAAEWPDASVKALDLGATEALAEAVAQEFLADDHREIGRRDARRVSPVLRDDTPAAAAHPMAKTWVVTGGARGVTARCIIEQAARAPGQNFLLLGRTPLDGFDDDPSVDVAPDAGKLKAWLFQKAEAASQTVSPRDLDKTAKGILARREIRDTLAALSGKAASARYVAVDVTDANAVQQAVDAFSSTHGPIEGLVHGAGVIFDRRVEDKRDDEVKLVLDTKLRGLFALLAATADQPVRTVSLFSSTAGRSGNAGQADYAMANEVLSKMAHQLMREKPALVARAVAWGPWDGGMVDASLKRHFESAGIAVIPLDEGANVFVRSVSEAKAAGAEWVMGASFAQDTVALSRHVDGQTHGLLADHAIFGTPVLPAVFAAHFLGEAARSLSAGATVRELRDVRVLRGVPLTGFENGGNDFDVVAEPQKDGTVRATLLSVGQAAPHYTATVEVGPQLAAPHVKRAAGLERYADEAAMYSEGLFHGPRFHLIERVEGINDQSMWAHIKGARAAGWDDVNETALFDTAALDAGLQMLLLFARSRTGQAFLPTQIERMVPYRPGALSGPLTCALTATRVTDDEVVCDVSILDEQGEVVLGMYGAHAHRLPSASYRRAQSAA